MKRNSILLPFAALALLCAGCDDDKMDWGTPEGQTPISGSEAIPLSIQEQINNYDYLKNYVKQYQSRLGSNFILGLGMGLQGYMDDAAYRSVADGNFQMYTPGNAMKQGVMVKNDGTIDFSTVDKFLAMIPSDARVYGHNFIWHTQQNQTYLKSLIAPDVVIKADPDDKMENIVANSDFEAGNTAGWGAWSSDGCSQQISDEGDGYESDFAILLKNPKAGNNYSAQAYYELPAITWQEGDVYILSCYVRADHADASFQAELQNRTSYQAAKYIKLPIEAADKWYYFEEEITVTADFLNESKTPTHITIDFGASDGNVWLDNVQFGKKKEGPQNYCSNGSFENDLDGWTAKNGADGVSVESLDDAPAGSKVLKMTASAEASNAWDLQVASPEMATMPGTMVELSFYVKSDQAGKGRVSFSGLTNGYPWMNWTGSQSSWTEAFETSTSWTLIHVVLQKFSTDFSDDASVWSFNLDFGYMPGVTYYIDNVQVVEYTDDSTTKSVNKASSVSYVIKSPEAKYEALDNAMEQWIKGTFEHFNGDTRFAGWDVINEAIADGGGRRGINGVFGGSWTEDDVTYYDQQPTETETEGLNLNWSSAAGNQHFYWGYYMGMDYAVKAFEYSRKYADANGLTDLKLFYNDYNLETSPSKLAEVIEFVKDIDAAAGKPIVDGIGTQMHVQSGIAREQIDAMFKTLAATGKLIRVTELDVAVNTASPSAAELEKQAKTYQDIIESYIENVPEAQRHGITIWTLSDAADEHEFWLNGDAPNLFTADLARKWAYKGVCDGIAGEDLGAKLSGDSWKDKNYQDRSELEAEIEETEEKE